MDSGIRTIIAVSGETVLIDAQDYELLSRSKWRVQNFRGVPYVLAMSNSNPFRQMSMGRVVMGLARGEGCVVIYKNGHLDCRRSSLLVADRSQLQGKGKKRSDNASGYKGVSFDKQCGKYKAQIRVKGKTLYIGRDSDPAKCHEMYKAAAVYYFGSAARVE